MTRFGLLRTAIFAAALVPAAALVYGFFTNDLTANPIDYITDTTGYTAISLLMISLSVTPLRRLTGWNEVIKLRRMLGLLAFFYACLHFSTWLVLDWFFDFASMAADRIERKLAAILAADGGGQRMARRVHQRL